jgi:hypothetical protein
MRTLHLISVAVTGLLLSGCQVWQPGGSPTKIQNDALTITPPAGWMYATRVGPDLLASKEGFLLQSIVIEHHDLTKPLLHSKRALSSGLAPYETAEAVVDDLRANHELQSFELQENTPASVGGRPGFKLIYSFRTKDKLPVTEEIYGAIAGERLWLVRYAAPKRHYFERDLPAFEAACQSLRFEKNQS